jgi:hypothetical protein
MNANQYTPHALDRLSRVGQSVLTARQLREHGMTPAAIAERSAPGGPWQEVLPQVYVLHRGRPGSGERVRAALLYAGRDPGAREAMVTGLAALALYRFQCVPELPGLPRIDVLVPRQRRLRDAGDVTLHRVRDLPGPQQVDGVPCAPVARALADAVAELDDLDTVRVLLSEAVRDGHCEASAVVGELAAARLLDLPHVRGAMDVLRALGRSVAEQRLYAMVGHHRLPDPVWNVVLTLPGGPPLGAVDAYWPEHAVAAVIDNRLDDEAAWTLPRSAAGAPPASPRRPRRHEQLEALGVTVLYLTPAHLRDTPDQQAAVVRTALTAHADDPPAAYVVVVPR